MNDLCIKMQVTAANRRLLTKPQGRQTSAHARGVLQADRRGCAQLAELGNEHRLGYFDELVGVAALAAIWRTCKALFPETLSFTTTAALTPVGFSSSDGGVCRPSELVTMLGLVRTGLYLRPQRIMARSSLPHQYAAPD